MQRDVLNKLTLLCVTALLGGACHTDSTFADGKANETYR